MPATSVANPTSGPNQRWRLPSTCGASAVTIGELRAGVLAEADLATHDRRLATLTAVLALEPIPVDGAVAAAWARLRVTLRDAGLRMPVSDSWIAATALAAVIVPALVRAPAGARARRPRRRA